MHLFGAQGKSGKTIHIMGILFKALLMLDYSHFLDNTPPGWYVYENFLEWRPDIAGCDQ